MLDSSTRRSDHALVARCALALLRVFVWLRQQVDGGHTVAQDWYKAGVLSVSVRGGCACRGVEPTCLAWCDGWLVP